MMSIKEHTDQREAMTMRNGNSYGFKLDARGLLLYDHGFLVNV